ncbi:hypothetical protein F5B21DRAFT_518840 [Xylaria acuta]|nr:hypothetical protein F5B21DRAFT_518840 [Xylaria acuta]
MMQTVLFQQEEIWKEFTYNTWPQFWPDGEDGRFRPPFNSEDVGDEDAEIWREIAKPQSQFPKYRKRFQKLDEDAERVERHILVQLDLKQKHAAIKEAHTTTVMSAAIVGFTIITIIFAPLSFLTSLFALPIDQFRQNQMEDKYTANYIGTWIATGEIASLAVTAAAILLACVYFLKLRVTWPIWSLVSIKFVLKMLYYPLWWDRFTSKRETRSPTNTHSWNKKASVRSIDLEGGHKTTNQETNEGGRVFSPLDTSAPYKF